ncbi:g1369 [Coccomyxa elongata]
MEKANEHRTTHRPKVAVILRGVAGSGKSTEASKILELAQSEGLVANAHARNDRWFSKRDCPHHCSCGVQMVLQDSQKKMYACQHGEKGCRIIGRAEDGVDSCMYLYIPSLELEAELDNLSAFMKDLESGHDVVVTENVFLHEVELYPYACAAKLANYVTYVVDMQGVDAHTADANASGAHHVYSLHERNRAVIERQIAQWQPVNPAVLPKQCKVIQCPYGKSKAHIVLAPIFTFEECQKESMPTACQREPVLGGHVRLSSQLGQGSSAQTLALGWRPQHSGAHAAPDGTSPAAAGMPNGSSGDMHNAGASACQPGPCAQVGEVSSPAIPPNAAGALKDEQPQEQAPIQGPAPPTKESAAEKQFESYGHSQPEAAPASVRVKPSRRDPRLRPRKGTTAAQPNSRGLPIEEDVICLVSDSEDEHAPAAGLSGTAAQSLRRPIEDVPSITMGPATPEQPVQAQPPSRIPRLQPQSAAQPVNAAGLMPPEADAKVRGYSVADVVSTPAQRKRRTARKDSAMASDAAAAIAHVSAGAEEGAVTQPGQKRARTRRAQINDVHNVDAFSGPGQKEGIPVDMQHSEQCRTSRSRQQQLSFPVQRRASQGGGAQGKRSPEQAPCKQQASAAPEGATSRLVHASAGLPGAGAPKVAQHLHGEEPSDEQAQCSGMEHEATVDAFYLKHCGSPRTAEQKGKAQIKDWEESNQRWSANDSDAETSESDDLLEDLAGAGIRSRFDKRRVVMQIDDMP